MTTALPHIDLDTSYLPRELMVKDLVDTSRPAWLVQQLRAHAPTICDVCRDKIETLDYAYYEQSRRNPAHLACWIMELPQRPVRVVTVRRYQR